jgi:hypothetical protein
LRNRSFAKGADSSEWLRVNVVWSEGSIKYREIPLYAKCPCDQKYYWIFFVILLSHIRSNVGRKGKSIHEQTMYFWVKEFMYKPCIFG